MSIRKTIGGDRLGSGKKMTVDLKTYERSTHNLSYLWRSTMAAGTLVPFMSEVGLPGDTFDIDLDVDVKTHPTIGPLFGSYKIQLDLFMCPVRLYQGQLHNNKLGIGMNMSNVKLPQIVMLAPNADYTKPADNQQINPSSIFSYLNIRGLGRRTGGFTIAARNFNAIPYLSYWDIYKNYYANKQEENGAVIHSGLQPAVQTVQDIQILYSDGTTGGELSTTLIVSPSNFKIINSTMYVNWLTDQPTLQYIMVGLNTGEFISILDLYQNIETLPDQTILSDPNPAYLGKYLRYWTYSTPSDIITEEPQVYFFPLSNIDDMRENILAATKTTTPFLINTSSPEPYNLPLLSVGEGAEAIYAKMTSQEGLAIKTYQSDLFNNWISTEWLDGSNGINEITAIDTSSGQFTIDTLNLSKKVYDMLNRIAISGGTYDDWLDTVYTHERFKRAESPMYMGGLIRELAFQEVISNAESSEGTQPLGTLAGKGVLTNKHKGGKITIKVEEPSYIMGIISLTPRVDYSQGNKWDVNLKTMDDFHKPALDEIGFQDLITDQMAWWDTTADNPDAPGFKSAGKQPAWINYMTNVNQVRGNFAIQENEMFMTLNRRYEEDDVTKSIKDLTTYIDPVKYNHIFAQTSRDAQNFWVQISTNITARRKMSAKIIPNL